MDGEHIGANKIKVSFICPCQVLSEGWKGNWGGFESIVCCRLPFEVVIQNRWALHRKLHSLETSGRFCFCINELGWSQQSFHLFGRADQLIFICGQPLRGAFAFGSFDRHTVRFEIWFVIPRRVLLCCGWLVLVRFVAESCADSYWFCEYFSSSNGILCGVDVSRVCGVYFSPTLRSFWRRWELPRHITRSQPFALVSLAAHSIGCSSFMAV